MADRTRDQIQAMRQGSIGRLFLRAHRAFSTRATAMLHERGHGDLSAEHTTLLAHIDIDGTNITTLAARAGMTKQSMGQLVSELVQQGYLDRVSDPHDKRAQLVKFTAKGWRFLQDAYEVKVAIDAEYSALLGKDRLRELYALLTELANAADSAKDLPE